MDTADTAANQPRWQRRPDARPDEIINAALAVFADAGFVGARLEEIAQRAGVSKGTLYLYFDSKEELFREVVRSKVVSVVEAGEQEVARMQGSAEDRLVRLIRAIWSVVSDPAMARITKLMHSELGNFPELAQFYYDEVIVRVRNLVRGVLADGVASGEFRAEQSDYAARAIPHLLVMGAKMLHFFRQFDPEPLEPDEIIDGAVDLILNGVRMRGGDQ